MGGLRNVILPLAILIAGASAVALQHTKASNSPDWNWCVVELAELDRRTDPQSGGRLSIEILEAAEVASAFRSLRLQHGDLLNRIESIQNDPFYPSQHPCLVFSRLTSVSVRGEQHLVFIVQQYSEFEGLPPIYCDDPEVGVFLLEGQTFEALSPAPLGSDSDTHATVLELFPNAAVARHDDTGHSGSRLGLIATNNSSDQVPPCLAGFKFISLHDYLSAYVDRAPPMHRVDQNIVQQLLSGDR